MESSLLAGWDNFYVIVGGAAAIMLLMIVGIHNAWDIAVWNSVNKQENEKP
jgi:hypothetical protein